MADELRKLGYVGVDADRLVPRAIGQAAPGLAENALFRAGATVASISGECSLSLGATGDLTAAASSALVGSTALAFGAGASTLTATGTLTGTAAGTFGHGSSALTGSGALAGAAAETITAAGTLEGTGALAGAADVAVGLSGDLTTTGGTTGEIGGDSAVAFVVTGTLETLTSVPLPTPGGPDAGVVTAYRRRKRLQAAGALAGVCRLRFTATGALTGRDAALSRLMDDLLVAKATQKAKAAPITVSDDDDEDEELAIVLALLD